MTDINERINNVIQPEGLFSAMRLCDDYFFRVAVDGHPEVAKAILAPILRRDDFTVTDVKAQYAADATPSRGVVFDCVVVFDDGTHVDLEVQKDRRGADKNRIRYYAGRFDSTLLLKGQDYEELPPGIVVFLVEGDLFGLDQPAYCIQRALYDWAGSAILDQNYEDGSRIYIVDFAREDDTTDLGKLMHDLRCAKSASMHNDILAGRVKDLKYETGGGDTMNETFERWKQQVGAISQVELLADMISKGLITEDTAAQALEVSVDEFRAIVAKLTKNQ